MCHRRRALLTLLLVSFTPASPAAAADDLQLHDLDLGFGVIGPARDGDDFYPADDLVFRFRVTGVRLDQDAQCRCEVRCELLDENGRSLRELKGNIRSILALGGGEFPAHVRFQTPRDMPPGKFTFAITLKDEIAGTSATVKRSLMCRPTEYRILSPRLFRDPGATLEAGTHWNLGERLFFKLMTVGSDRSTKKLHAVMRIQVLDADGKPTLPEPLKFELKEEDPEKVEQAFSATLSGSVGLNRAGKFTLRIEVEDPIGKQKDTVELPVIVHPL